MTVSPDAPGARAGSPADAQGLALVLLAIVLAVGTALPQLRPGGPGLPPPPEPEVRGGPAPQASVPSPPGATGRSPGAIATRPKPLLVTPLNLNASDSEALQSLPGVGPTLAQRIVAHREANGPFQTREDLLRVPGIGPKRWERIRPLVRLAEGP